MWKSRNLSHINLLTRVFCRRSDFEHEYQIFRFYLAFLTFSLVAGWFHIHVFMLGQASMGRSPRCHARQTHDTRLSQAPCTIC